MPKKSRKMKERAAQRRTIATQSRPEAKEESVVGASPVTSATRAAPMPRQSPQISFDYSHIYADLRRIALFAGFFFAVLIALSFVIK